MVTVTDDTRTPPVNCINVTV